MADNVSAVKGVLMYDRTALRAAARSMGIENPTALARELKVSVPTAWRLWEGTHRPSAKTLDAVQQRYGLTAGDLLHPATATA